MNISILDSYSFKPLRSSTLFRILTIIFNGKVSDEILKLVSASAALRSNVIEEKQKLKLVFLCMNFVGCVRTPKIKRNLKAASSGMVTMATTHLCLSLPEANAAEKLKLCC